MSDWPDGWLAAVVADLGAESTPFLTSALRAWQQSTPVPTYTNNPFGMPYKRGVSAQLLSTGYAMYPSMAQFRARFVAFMHSPEGAGVRDALLVTEKLGPLWRAIRALNWPGNATETDYPAKLLDLMTEKTRSALQTTEPTDRKTAGVIGYSSTSEHGMNKLGDNLQRAANVALNAANALRRY